MAHHNQTGTKGEKLAVNYLIKNGYSIVATNWRYKKNEIDIIAQKNDLLVFIEVKTRSSEHFGSPEVFVTPQKRKRIIRAANAYVLEKDLLIDARFDIITVVFEKGQHKITYFKDAFSAFQ